MAFMLTTIDNPYDPFEDFARWWRFDNDHQYNTSGRLATVTFTSDQLSVKQNEQEIERAIDEFLRYDVEGKHIKVQPSDFQPLSKWQEFIARINKN